MASLSQGCSEVLEYPAARIWAPRGKVGNRGSRSETGNAPPGGARMTRMLGGAVPSRRYRLQSAREIYGWSQQEVAERIGTTALNVSRWERGITTPGPYFRAKLSLLFGRSKQELDLAE